MEKIFRILSTHTSDETERGLKNITLYEYEFMVNLFNDLDCIDFKFDGKRYNPKGYIEVLFTRFDDEKLDKFLEIDRKLHEDSSGWTKVEDITKQVLYTIHDTSMYGLFEKDILEMFHRYKTDYITKDDILDKIWEYGISSITENDKNILNDLPLEL